MPNRHGTSSPEETPAEVGARRDSRTRDSRTRDRRSSGRRILLPLIVAGVCGLEFLGAGLPRAFSPVGQLDFRTYYYAVKVYDAGGNPWDTAQVEKAAGGEVHNFIYPPHTLAFFRLFACHGFLAAKHAYLITELSGVAVLLALWTAYFVETGARGWFLAFAAVGYSAPICCDLELGNVSIIEQVPIWLGLWALLRGRLALFCGLIILAAQFKLVPVCLLALLLLTESPRKWLYLLGSLVVCGLIAARVYGSDPLGVRMFLDWASAVAVYEAGGTFHPSSLAFVREAAERVVQSSDLLSNVSPVMLGDRAYALYVVAVLGVYVWAVRRRTDLRLAVFTGLLTYVLLAPRMKEYSYIMALVPTFELIRVWATRKSPTRLLALAVGGLIMLGLPGFELAWKYRSLVLAGWAWACGVTMFGEREDSPAANSAKPALQGGGVPRES
jgi:hypothetical protein